MVAFRFIENIAGLYLHRDRIGTIKHTGNTYVFTAIEPDGFLFIDVLTERPKLMGRAWSTALSGLRDDVFTQEKWKEDYSNLVAQVKENIEDRLLEDEEDSNLIEYNEDSDEDKILWNKPEIEKIVKKTVKDMVADWQWYKDDACLDKALSYMNHSPKIIFQSAANWCDYKRMFLLSSLEETVYQSILDRVA